MPRGWTRYCHALALLVASIAGTRASIPQGYDYVYDGETTYCYNMGQGVDVVNFDYSYNQIKAKGSACPLILHISSSTTGSVLVNNDVQFEFTVKTNFDDNAFNMTSLLARLNDGNGVPTEIPHANVHACDASSTCDIFRTGKYPTLTSQEMANFTSGAATFTPKLAFSSSGSKNIYGHIMLPGKSPYKESLHFMVFMNLNILSASATTAPSTSSSTGMMIGVIVGAIAVIIGVVLFCTFHKRGSKRQDDDMFPMSPSPGFPGASKHSSRLGWSHRNPDPFDTFEGSMASQFRAEAAPPPPLCASQLAFDDNPAAENAASRMLKVGGGGPFYPSNSRHGSSYHGSAKGGGGSSHGTQRTVPMGYEPDATFEYFAQGGQPESYDSEPHSVESETSIGTSTSIDYPTALEQLAANGGGFPPVYNNAAPYTDDAPFPPMRFSDLPPPLSEGAFGLPDERDRAFTGDSEGSMGTANVLSQNPAFGGGEEAGVVIGAGSAGSGGARGPAPAVPFHVALAGQSGGRDPIDSELESQCVDTMRTMDFDDSSRTWETDVAVPNTGSAFEL